MAGKSIWDGFRAGIQTDSEIAIQLMFPAKNRFQMLQMLTDQNSGAMMAWSVLGVFRRMYKSKALEELQEEYMLNKVSDNRKGRLEGSEISSSRLAKEAGDKD